VALVFSYTVAVKEPLLHCNSANNYLIYACCGIKQELEFLNVCFAVSRKFCTGSFTSPHLKNTQTCLRILRMKTME
jgi:hypothetical protein